MKYSNSNNLSTQSKKTHGERGREKGKRYTRNWIQKFKIEFENIGVVPPNEKRTHTQRERVTPEQTHAEINRLKQEWNLYDEVAWTNNNNTPEGLSAVEKEENRNQNIFKRQSMREDKKQNERRWEKWSQRWNSFCCRCAHVLIFGRSVFLLIILFFDFFHSDVCNNSNNFFCFFYTVSIIPSMISFWLLSTLPFLSFIWRVD